MVLFKRVGCAVLAESRAGALRDEEQLAEKSQSSNWRSELNSFASQGEERGEQARGTG